MKPASQFVDVGDTSIHVATAGSGPALVFLHGLGWDHHLWDAAFTHYSSQYRVIAGDTRGHGRSDKPHTPYSISLFAQDWLTVLDRLQIQRAVLVGFSQGGMVAMAMALQQPQRFTSLVLAGTTCCIPPAVSDNLQQRLEQLEELGALAAAKLACRSIFSPRFIEANPDYIQHFIHRRAATDQTVLNNAMQAVTGFSVCAQLCRLPHPCLVLAAADDRLTPPEAVEAIHRHLPHSRFIVIPETGHMMPVEQPQFFYAQIDQALEQLYPRLQGV